MPTFRSRNTRPRQPGWLLAVLSTGVLVASASGGNLQGFVAPVTADSFSGQGLLVEESSGNLHCTSTIATQLDAATCPGINRLGAGTAMPPGRPVTTTITLMNVGDVPVHTLALAADPCTQVPSPQSSPETATDLCGRIHITVTADHYELFRGTAESLGHTEGPAFVMPSALRPGARTSVTFVATLDSTCGNAYQDLTASLPVTWTFAP